MKSFSLTYLVLLSLSTLSAQSYNVDWGGEYRRPGGIYTNFFLAGLTEDAYHMLLYTRKENTLFSYDWNHKLIDTKPVEFSTGKDDIKLNNFTKTQSGNFAVLTQYNRRTKEVQTFVSKFENQDFSDLKQTSLQSVQGSSTAAAMASSLRDDDSPLVTSPDKSKALLTQTDPFVKYGEPEQMKLIVYDADFEHLWNREYTLQFDDDEVQILQSSVNNTGEVFLLLRIRKERSQRRQETGLPPYRYELHKITSDQDVETLEVDLGGNLAPQYTGLYLSEYDNEQVVIAGMYTDSERRSNLKGAFLLEIGDDFTINRVNTQEFSNAFLTDLISIRANKRDRGLNNAYLIKSFFRFLDGTLGFIAEETYITTITQASGPNGSSGRTSTVYHTDAIVTIIFNPDGELVTMQKIDKAFDSPASIVTSFATAVVDDQLFIVYNDKKNRSERREIRGKGNRGRALFTDLTIIDNTGEISYEENLFTSDATDRKAFIPNQLDYNTDYMVLLARSRKFFQCGLLYLR
ncbi:MAG: hypothetical protein AAFO03_18220 [Bacteroidota bacterium]